MCGNDAFMEGGHYGQRSGRNITILGLRSVDLQPGSIPTVNAHTVESQQLKRLGKAATLIPWPEASRNRISHTLKGLLNIH